MKRCKEILLFSLISLFSCLALFQDAMWGASIAAPLDLAPALWRHYRHVDPQQGPIPSNHYIGDQLGYDLPLQYLMHRAWRSGDIPWWNPYSLGGRPLLADAHCNGTDPIRLAVYFTIPNFVLAYNWTLVLHCLGTGIAFFVLLRGIGIRRWLAAACALTAQWAGGYVLYIGHPWVRATFLYYPLLWLAWHRATRAGRFSAAAVPIIAAIFYSGNLQSHTCLPIFALAAGAGFAGRDSRKWWTFLRIAIPAIVLGALIASPVLVPQIELYAQSARAVGVSPNWYWFETASVLAGIHPWAAGTFRTISVKAVNGGPSFHLAIGGVAIVLGILGWARRNRDEGNRSLYATSACLVIAFLLIAVSPLHPIFYLRSAGLGIMGLVMLAALGAEGFLQARQPEPRWSRLSWLLAAGLAVGTTMIAELIYPSFREKVRAMMLAHAESDGYGGASLPLRNFQVDNFAPEVSLRNPECALNLGGLGILAMAFAASGSGQRIRLGWAVAISLIPLMSFANRFIVCAPVENWARLLHGGPNQARFVEQFAKAGTRLKDDASQEYHRLFPMEVAALHRLHVTHGYAALPPRHAPAADSEAVQAGGIRSAAMPFESVQRFVWKTGQNREIRVVDEKLSRTRISFPPGAAVSLQRTDTWYSGWMANGAVLDEPGGAGGASEIPVRAGETEIVFQYRPRWFRECIGIAILATGIGVWLAWSARFRPVRGA